MTPRDAEPWRQLLDELANALQSAVLLVEHLERTSAAAARDVTAITLSLSRATEALAQLRARGGKS